MRMGKVGHAAIAALVLAGSVGIAAGYFWYRPGNTVPSRRAASVECNDRVAARSEAQPAFGPRSRNTSRPSASWPAPPAVEVSFGDGDPAFPRVESGFEIVASPGRHRADFEPHGDQVCASGCASSHHPTDKLSAARFAGLLKVCVREPLDENNASFETLLFYGNQARKLFDQHRAERLHPDHAAVIRRELSRSHVRVSLRLVDDAGEEHAYLPATRVPLDRRHVFSLQSTGLPALVASGTVKRVGLHHLWTRL